MADISHAADLAQQARVVPEEDKQAIADQRVEQFFKGIQPDDKNFGPSADAPAWRLYSTSDLLIHGVGGGLRDAAQEVLNSTAMLAKALNLPGADTGEPIKLPDIQAPETTAGELARPVVSFLSGFLPVSRALKGVGLASALTRDVVAAGAAGALTMPGDTWTLADTLAEVPGLGEAIPEFMRSSPGDTTAESKMSQVLNEVLGTAVVAPALRGVMGGLKYLRGAKPIRNVSGVATPATKLRINPDNLKAAMGGDPAAPSITQIITEKGANTRRVGVNFSAINTPEDITAAMQTTETALGSKDIVAAGHRLVGSTAKHLQDLATKITQGDNSLETLAAFRKAYSVHTATGAMQKGSRDLAQAALDQGFTSQTAKDAFAELQGPAGRQWTELAKRVAMSPRRGIIEAPPELGANVHRSEGWLGAYWANNLVSGVSTQLINTATNTLNLFAIPTEKALATALSRGPTASYYELKAMAHGFLEGGRDAFRISSRMKNAGAVQRAFVTGEPGLDKSLSKLDYTHGIEPPDLRKVFEGGPSAVVGNIAKTALTGPSRGLLAGDEGFKVMLHRMELHRQAMQQALETGLTGRAAAEEAARLVANPSEEMLSNALEAARYGTFTQKLGEKGQLLLDMRNANGWSKFFFPFVRTPTNIAKFAAERSPLAPALQHVRAELSSPDVYTRRLAQIRMTYGTFLMAMAAKWAIDGDITGGGPIDPELNKLWKGDRVPYAVHIGGQWVQYNRAQPWGFLLGAAADLAAISGYTPQPQFDNVWSAILASIYRNTLDVPFVQGFGDLADLIGGVREGSTQAVGSTAANILSTLISPRILSQVGRAEDPVMRSTRTLLDSVMNQLPGWRKDLPVMHDALGDEVLLNAGYGEDWLGTATRFAVPAVIRKDESRLKDVRDFLLENGIDVGPMRREIGGVKIDEATYQEMAKMRGQIVVPQIRQMMHNPAFREQPRPIQEKIIKGLFATAGEMASQTIAARPGNELLRLRMGLLAQGALEREGASMQRPFLSVDAPR